MFALIGITLIFSTNTLGKTPFFNQLERIEQSKVKNKHSKLMLYLMKSKYFFSAVHHAKKHLKMAPSVSIDFDKAFDSLVIKVGIDHFMDIEQKDLLKSYMPSARFIAAQKYFESKKYNQAISELEKIPEDHKFSPESLMLSGVIYNILDQKNKSLDRFYGCIQNSSFHSSKTKSEKTKRFYQVLAESCKVNISRVHYKNKSYELAERHLEEIPKRSYIWPYVLRERAWNSYNQRDFNRSLGILVTYKAPLLQNYFIPEAEVLTSLNYLELCLWDDALIVVKQFHEKYAPQSEALQKVVKEGEGKAAFFFDRMFQYESAPEKENVYIAKILHQVRKKLSFNIKLSQLRVIHHELKRLGVKKGGSYLASLLSQTQLLQNKLKDRLNKMIQEKMYQFVNEMNRLSEEMYNIHLEVLMRKKNDLYATKPKEVFRKRGGEKNVNRKKNQYYFTFNGEFWADELGDYSFGLKSECKEL